MNSLISNIRMLFCLLSFLPALVMMCLIFSFSAQTGEESGSLSSKISHMAVDVGNQIFHLDLTESEIESYAGSLEHPIRKLAHMTEYFILTILVLFPLFICGLRGRSLVLTALFFCVSFLASGTSGALIYFDFLLPHFYNINMSESFCSIWTS